MNQLNTLNSIGCCTECGAAAWNQTQPTEVCEVCRLRRRVRELEEALDMIKTLAKELHDKECSKVWETKTGKCSFNCPRLLFGITAEDALKGKADQ
jgi:hypothetical protein